MTQPANTPSPAAPPCPPTSPALAHSSWRHLLKALRTTPQFKPLSALSAEFLQAALAAPATLARWLAATHPALLERTDLHIVIAGAARGPDSLDAGRWYQALPGLLNRPGLRVRISLVGPELAGAPKGTPGRIGMASAATLESGASALIADWPAASVHAVKFAEWWVPVAEGEPLPDAVFAFHPAHEAFAGSWFSSVEGLAAAHAAGVPIGFTSHCIEEWWHDSWLAARYGFASGRPAENPFFQETEKPKHSGQWAGVMWALEPKVGPASDFVVNKGSLVRFHLALEQARPAFTAGGNAAFAFIGGVNRARSMETEEVALLVGMPSGLMLNLATGGVLAQGEDALFQPVLRIPPLDQHLMADFPGEAAHPVDRFIWACETFRGYIEAVFYRTGPDALREWKDLFKAPTAPV